MMSAVCGFPRIAFTPYTGYLRFRITNGGVPYLRSVKAYAGTTLVATANISSFSRPAGVTYNSNYKSLGEALVFASGTVDYLTSIGLTIQESWTKIIVGFDGNNRYAYCTCDIQTSTGVNHGHAELDTGGSPVDPTYITINLT